MTVKRPLAIVLMLAASSLLAGCGGVPGRPTSQERWVAPAEVADFNQLYTQNCAGCHGAGGRLGAAHPLNDPLYLAVAGPDALRRVTAQGVTGTTMPAFAQEAGGNLTGKQIDILVEGIESRWARPDEFKGVTLPPYSPPDGTAGDAQRGAVAYQTYCAQCHGANGQGGARGGSIVDPNYLALASDQYLRTTIITGRSDLGKPDWRADVPGKPLSPQEISDLVAWLAAQRSSAPSSSPPVSFFDGRSSEVRIASAHPERVKP